MGTKVEWYRDSKRYCSLCRHYFDLTQFIAITPKSHKDLLAKDGLSPHCTPCRQKRIDAYWREDGMRRCMCCGVFQEVDQFKPATKDSAADYIGDGYGRDCASCRGTRRKHYYRQHRTREIAYALKWMQDHPERAREIHRKAASRYDHKRPDRKQTGYVFDNVNTRYVSDD